MFLRFLLALSLLLLAITAVHAQVVINEFMYYPDSSQNEWVELYNISNDAVNLNEWTIRDNATDSTEKQALFDSIPIGGYLIVARRPEMFSAQYGALSCTVIDVSFQQYNDNGGDAITVQNKAGDTVDYVAYDNTWGKQRGYSLEKKDPRLPSRAQSSWSVSAVKGGTPCGRNSTASVQNERTAAAPRVRFTDRRLIEILFDESARNGREARLMSSDGRTAFTTHLDDASAMIDCAGLAAGSYMLVIVDREHVTSVVVPVVLQ